jgi:hypothetical protein
MAYYIFLKSLRSLEEFKKNSHVKIPSKSRSTNFQSFGKFKNLIFNSEILFLAFGPTNPVARTASSPASPPAAPSPQAKIVPAGPSSPRVDRVFTGNTFSLSDHASPSSLCQPGPTCQINPLPRAGRPRLEIPHAAAPSRRCLAPRMPPSFYSPPSSLSPLNPLQTEP